MTRRRGGSLCAAVLLACTCSAGRALADDGHWHALDVPGGRATLTLLGLPEDGPRATAMVDIIRRFHFSDGDEPALMAALAGVPGGRPQPGTAAGFVVPSPLSLQSWSEVIFRRDMPPHRLFVEILRDEHARLLFHGLAGLDRDTRQWFEQHRELLRWLYRQDDAVRSFAWFAPAVKIVKGRIVLPGGREVERQWSAALGAAVTRPEDFVRRLFGHNAGRTAGLYFVFTAVDDPRRAFLMGARMPQPIQQQRFQRLVSGFATCYPERSTAYPFAVRSHDAALLLLEVGLSGDGTLAGPADRRFWHEVLGGRLGEVSGTRDATIDAAWMAEALCGAAAEDRAATFVTLLAAHRIFTGLQDPGASDTAAALRARTAYPALFMALEHAGLRAPRTYAAAARHAARLSSIGDAGRGVTALRQFQGAVMLTLNAAIAGTLNTAAAEALIDTLSALPLDNEQYLGGVADWLTRQFLPAVTPALSGAARPPELSIAAALAGPAHVPLRPVHWEGLDYVVDVAGTSVQRLLDVRKRQGGVALDRVIELHTIVHALSEPLPRERVVAMGSALEVLMPQLRLPIVADEYEHDGVNVQQLLSSAVTELRGGRTPGVAGDLAPVVDVLLAHVLPSWAYAPHLGGADSGALVGGDASLRHRLGVRLMGRSRAEQRWQLALSPAARGSIAGSILGVQTALASWSLHRLSSAAVPAPLAIESNDAIPLALNAALSNPRHLTDADLVHLTRAQATGSAMVMEARTDPDALASLATRASLSPWRRAILAWMMREEPERLEEQFPPRALAHLGGIRAGALAGWGSVSLASGSLALAVPPLQVPELFAGRSGNGIVGGRSVDLMMRVAVHLAEMNLPATLAAPVLSFAMRDYIDRVRPAHGADADAFARQARALTRRDVEDYVGAVAAIGPLRPLAARP